MKTESNKASYLALLITGFAIVLFSTAGIARIMGWGPGSTEDSDDIVALDQEAPVPPAGGARAGPRCSECGVIVSMREVGRHDEDTGPGAAGEATAGNQGELRAYETRHYEIVVRMSDGSSRVIDHASPARWRTGERLIVIAGTDPSRP
jgi:hypothetical protein